MLSLLRRTTRALRFLARMPGVLVPVLEMMVPEFVLVVLVMSALVLVLVLVLALVLAMQVLALALVLALVLALALVMSVLVVVPREQVMVAPEATLVQALVHPQQHRHNYSQPHHRSHRR